jgi:hypothetical protein
MKNNVKNLLIGILLGDASIYLNTNKDKGYVTFAQSAEKKEYISHIHQVLKKANLVEKDIRGYVGFDKRYNKERYSY